MKKKNDDISNFISNMQDALNTALHDIAVDIGYEIENLYEQTINAFYANYTPQYYKRTEMTFRGSDMFNKYPEPKFENGFYEIGITVSPNNIPGNPYRAEKDWVFDRTFNKGYHGYTFWEARRFARAHYDSLEAELRMMRTTWKNLPKSTKKQTKYYFNYKYSDVLNKSQRAMNPPPVKLLKRAFKEKKKELKETVNQRLIDKLTETLS